MSKVLKHFGASHLETLDRSAAAVTHQLNTIAGDVPTEKTRTIAELLDEAVAQERLMSAIGSVPSSLLITMGRVGLYAVMSYDVARRTRELGIRIALYSFQPVLKQSEFYHHCG